MATSPINPASELYGNMPYSRRPHCNIPAPDIVFFAMINIGADKSDDLYFREFELAPEPDDDDGLA